MIEWIRSHELLLGWSAVLALASLLGTLAVATWLLVRLPPDFFEERRRHRTVWGMRHPLERASLLVAKNLLGALLILAGLVMLVLPGQGLLTIVAGILLVDFPGKYRLERWLISQPGVLRAINWLRRRANRRPLTVRREMDNADLS